MPVSDQKLDAHLKGGQTTLCRCWAVTRTDGQVQGFTDHDRDLRFEGIVFRADTGLSARALQQGTGLSVDNSEAMGALSSAAIREEDIEAGRYDGAEVRAWLVNWRDVGARRLQFRGTLGEIRRAGGAFQAELRGLTEALNRPIGRVYQRPCTAVLGDSSCRFDLAAPGFAAEVAVEEVHDGRVFRWADVLGGFGAGWFNRGRMEVISGDAQGLSGIVKHDGPHPDGARVVELWEPIRANLAAGDVVRLQAGCDKRLVTCRQKFNNIINFQGFPDIPGEDWIMAVPKKSGANTGGSLR